MPITLARRVLASCAGREHGRFHARHGRFACRIASTRGTGGSSACIVLLYGHFLVVYGENQDRARGWGCGRHGVVCLRFGHWCPAAHVRPAGRRVAPSRRRRQAGAIVFTSLPRPWPYPATRRAAGSRRPSAVAHSTVRAAVVCVGRVARVGSP